MSSEPEMTLRHDAFVYGSAQEFVDTLVPFICAGVERGEPVVAVVPSANETLLCDALGREARKVDFIDSAEWYAHPVRTIAGYSQTLNRHLEAGAPSVRVIGEVHFGSSGTEHSSWTKYEAVLNRVFAASPAWIVCPYDTRSLPAAVVEDAFRTHPQVVVDGARRTSDLYAGPEAVVSAKSAAGRVPTRVSRQLVATPTDLPDVRRAVGTAARSAGLGPDKVDGAVAAVNEALTNALRHGKPPVSVATWRDREAFTCEVSDGGHGVTDPLAGYVPPTSESENGYGLWIMRQTCDDVELRVAPEGFTVRLALRTTAD